LLLGRRLATLPINGRVASTWPSSTVMCSVPEERRRRILEVDMLGRDGALREAGRLPGACRASAAVSVSRGASKGARRPSVRRRPSRRCESAARRQRRAPTMLGRPKDSSPFLFSAKVPPPPGVWSYSSVCGRCNGARVAAAVAQRPARLGAGAAAVGAEKVRTFMGPEARRGAGEAALDRRRRVGTSRLCGRAQGLGLAGKDRLSRGMAVRHRSAGSGGSSLP